MMIEIEFDDPGIVPLSFLLPCYLWLNIANCSMDEEIKIKKISIKTPCGDPRQEEQFDPAICFRYLSLNATWAPLFEARVGTIYNFIYNRAEKKWNQKNTGQYPNPAQNT